MKALKQALRKVSIIQGLSSIKEILQEYVERSKESLEWFEGTFDDLILAQAVKVLRKQNTTIGRPQELNNFNGLVNLIKSIKEVKDNVSKDLLCRRENPGK